MMRTPLPFVPSDGGRAAAGFKGKTGDCACRALAIASKHPYMECYELLLELSLRERRSAKDRSHPRTGVWVPTFRKAAAAMGLLWTPTKLIGSPETVHLAEGELPMGRLICRVSRHYVAVVDGVVHDTHDPCRDGDRIVYGFWRRPWASAGM
jgi:hypothetical protein